MTHESTAPTRIIVWGATGRTGARIVALAEEHPAFEVVARVSSRSPWSPASDATRDVDVIIDFSTPEGTREALVCATRLSAGLLVGTTGAPAPIAQAMGDFARSLPILVASNTSLGVAVLAVLAAEAARRLGPEYDVDLVETHRRGKRDAPSGTALHLAASVNAAEAGALPADRIHAVRTGDVVGEHVLRFSGPDEQLTLAHAASSRDVFARGALRAAAWLKGRSPGRYGIEDVVAAGEPG